MVWGNYAPNLQVVLDIYDEDCISAYPKKWINIKTFETYFSSWESNMKLNFIWKFVKKENPKKTTQYKLTPARLEACHKIMGYG